MSQTITTQNCTLLITNTSGNCVEHIIGQGQSQFLGSSSNCGILVDEPDVAGMHCLISLQDGELRIQNWASSGDTVVNGTAIDGQVLWSCDDTVTVGSVTLAVKATRESASPAALEIDDVLAIEAIAEEAELDTNISDLDAVASPIEFLATTEPDKEPVIDSGWGDFVDDDYEESDTQYGQETVDLLKAEIEDLRAMLADHDLGVDAFAAAPNSSPPLDLDGDEANVRLQRRVDELLAEAAEQDERTAILADLLETAAYKDQAETEERAALESWIGEVEQRIGQRESEWEAELSFLKQQLESTKSERDDSRNELRQVAARYNAPEVYQETLDRLQTRNAELEEETEAARTEVVNLKKQLDSAQNQESADICEERAQIAKERAELSRLRFELSSKLNEFGEMPEPQHQEDRDFAMRLRDLRTELRAINEVQRAEREEKGESLISRISSLWKRVDEY